ncbi:MAG: SPOR domain-containing protein, partial [Desulfovibrio sp.]
VIALEDQERARQFYETLISQDYTHARIVQVMIGERWIYRVQIGAFASLSQAQAAMDRVALDYPDAFITSESVP